VTDQIDTGNEDTGIRIYPPVVMLAALILAYGLDWIWPSRVGVPDIARYVVGAVLIALPFIGMPSILAAFRRAGAAFDVRRVPRGLVTTGLYRYSRNPGYILGVALCAGIGLISNNPWVFLTLAGAIAVIHFAVVLQEEEVLENRFGEDYLDYKRRVRRWL
jgi:protein-S-isoprenylcysteine O-methyltransferase Ste14